MSCPCTMGECACRTVNPYLSPELRKELLRLYPEAVCVEVDGVCQLDPCLCKEGADAEKGW